MQHEHREKKKYIVRPSQTCHDQYGGRIAWIMCSEYIFYMLQFDFGCVNDEYSELNSEFCLMSSHKGYFSGVFYLEKMDSMEPTQN